MKQLVAASLIVAGAFASQAAWAASTVDITWQGPDTAGLKLSTMDTTVSNSVPLTSNFATTALNYVYTATGESFAAYCIQPGEGNGRALRNQTYTIESFTGVQAQQLQGLFSTSYAGLTTHEDKAAFQLAIWELMLETGNTFSVNGGSFHLLGSDAVSQAVSAQANSFLSQALAYQGPALYSLTKLTHGNLQDLVVATPVPEPESYAMLLAGLGIVGLVARRRLPR
ncbi:MAG: PEP-CTERM sorting domain-containing protein [Comamonadaceae bacterium]|nr:PEP-CTERM sorting domain-containing protein [Comamonadaceae bacterium]